MRLLRSQRVLVRCRPLVVGLVAVCALGCVTTAAAPDPTDSTSADTGTTTGTGSTTYDPPVACAGSDECAPGHCVAPYDAASEGRGDAVCVDACVPELALDRWCIDDAACCDGLECGAIDGLCVRPDAGTDTSVGETWATLGTSEDSSSGGTTDTFGDTFGDTSSDTSSESTGTDDTSSTSSG